MLDWTQCSAVERVPGKVSGAWAFSGTHVPVQALVENLEGGATVDPFLESFPAVTREQTLTVLKLAESSPAASAAWAGVLRRLLCDQGRPAPLRHAHAPHQVVTAVELGRYN